MQILHDIFTYYADAAAELGLDKDYATQVIATRNKLVPPLINRHGRIQEWAQDWEQTEVMHRHLSHLYGLYPGNVLTYEKTPQFMPAARAALVERGDSSHGNAPWSMAWKIPLWARIKDGEQANKMLKLYIHRHAMAQFFTGAIMQIDGTMGLTAGVTEMLIQSHESTIKFLPAIPQAWHTRGAFVFDMKWANNKLTNLKMYSRTGGLCKLDLSPKTKVLDSKGKKVAVKKLPNGGISFETKAGASYTITPL